MSEMLNQMIVIFLSCCGRVRAPAILPASVTLLRGEIGTAEECKKLIAIFWKLDWKIFPACFWDCSAQLELSLSQGSPFTFAGSVLSWQLWPLGWGGQVQYQWLRQAWDFVVPVFLL